MDRSKLIIIWILIISSHSIIRVICILRPFLIQLFDTFETKFKFLELQLSCSSWVTGLYEEIPSTDKVSYHTRHLLLVISWKIVFHSTRILTLKYQHDLPNPFDEIWESSFSQPLYSATIAVIYRFWYIYEPSERASRLYSYISVNASFQLQKIIHYFRSPLGLMAARLGEYTNMFFPAGLVSHPRRDQNSGARDLSGSEGYFPPPEKFTPLTASRFMNSTQWNPLNAAQETLDDLNTIQHHPIYPQQTKCASY